MICKVFSYYGILLVAVFYGIMNSKKYYELSKNTFLLCVYETF